jgi:hypothetical protein
MRLIDLVQSAVIHSPRIIIAIEQAARAFVAEERRRELAQRLSYLDANALAAVDALVGQLEENDRHDDPSGRSTTET